MTGEVQIATNLTTRYILVGKMEKKLMILIVMAYMGKMPRETV